MSILKRAAAGAAALCMALSLTACQDTTWAFRIDGTEITSGMYLTFLINARNQASTMVTDTTNGLWEQTIEDKPADQWVKDQAKELSLQYVAVENEFERLGLTLSDEDRSTIDSQVESYWSSVQDYYEPNGAGQASFAKVMENSYKSSLLFDEYYGEGGIQEVGDEELQKYYQENYAQVKYVYMPFTDAAGNEMTDEQVEELKTKAEGYIDRIKNGENIDDLIAEYEEEQSTSVSSDTSGESSSDSSAATSSEEEVSNLVLIPKDNSSGYYPEALVTAAFEDATVGGDPVLVSDTDAGYYLVMQRFNVLDDLDTYEENRSAILSTYKSEDFNTLVSSWAENYTVETNDASISRYKPQNIKEPVSEPEPGVDVTF